MSRLIGRRGWRRLLRLSRVGEKSFEISHPPRQVLLLGAGFGRHGMDGFEFVAGHQIHAREDPLELLTQPRFDLTSDPRQGSDRTRGDTGKVIQKPALALHRAILRAARDRRPDALLTYGVR